jgi:hypothetical protein
MSLESFGFIKDLVATNPTGTDPKSQGDDHLRGIKETLLNQFPGFTLGKGVLLTEDELNALKTPPGKFMGVALVGNKTPHANLINWNTELFDTDSAFNPATPDRIIIPAGVIRVRFNYQFVANSVAAAGTFTTYLYKNGVNFPGGPQTTGKNYDATAQTLYFNASSGWVPCVAGDYFQLWVQTAPTTSNTTNNLSAEFSAT